MANSKSTRRKPSSPAPFVLNRNRGAKISAVEGMALTRRMAALLESSEQDGLSGDETRSRIRRELAGK